MSTKGIGETLAAVGVVASLIFVGMEIRQSNAQAKAAAYQSIGVATAEAFDSWAHDSELATLRFLPASEMEAADWQRYALKFSVFARLGETILLQVDLGILEEGAMETLGYRGWATIFDHPKIACVWPLIRPGVSDAFREYVEEGKDTGAIDCSVYAVPIL